jgi:2-polyprenyl-3-methyl-5-hydroxy-6-metoxy-1,4-benzoquinol methylase
LKKEIYQLTFESEETYWWYLGRRRIILDQIQASLSKMKVKKPVLLDIGCGTGINLVEFNKISDAYGMDAAEEALRFCRQRGLKKLALMDSTPGGSIQNPFRKKYDIITMLDVLEHIEQVAGYLTSVSEWLSRDGFIFMTVPAYQWLWSGEDVVSRHVRRYTRRQLIQTVQEAGLRVEKISYFNTILFPAQVLVILFSNLFIPQSKTQTNLHKMSVWFNAILQGILSNESGLIKRVNLPFGGSILCICRKGQS